MDRIKELEEAIAELPQGYISKKTISGKTRFYRQWTENKKIRSEYIREEELESLQKAMEQKKALRQELRALKRLMPKKSGKTVETNYQIKTLLGEELQRAVEFYDRKEKRDCFELIKDYLSGDDFGRVCLVYGLRRTGKTTMLFQAIRQLPIETTAYLKASTFNTIFDLDHDLKLLVREGYRYIFIDEITLIRDFIDSASLLSDIYAVQGVKIVISGTDSLGFWLAEREELYDRAIMIHTTYIPFREHSRLLGICDIDEYIRYGGTLRAGETNFDRPELYVQNASFFNDESTRKYIDTAICSNIQNSLKCYESGGHFRHLEELYREDELTGAINRIIEDMNHRFVLEVLTRDFVSNDLGLARRNLLKSKDPKLRDADLSSVDFYAVTNRLRHLLEIRNRNETKIKLTEDHVKEIKEYLRALDLIVECPIETIEGTTPLERTLFSQPGMRFCQAQVLVFSLMRDEAFAGMPDEIRNAIRDTILNEVRGRMMEDMILLETIQTIKEPVRIFKLQFSRGEFDMVAYDPDRNRCSCFEIKHSDQMVAEQTRNLINEDLCALTEHRFGPIESRIVLYRGKDGVDERGIQYRNAEHFLQNLPKTQFFVQKCGFTVEMG
ncbi:MAG: AAA family ATPase [Clostridia bacterium]|nr:AAA family ATPase [Clostridia bacterium]